MGKNICVTVDGSDLSFRGLPVAASLAGPGDRIEVVTAVEPIPPFHVPDYRGAAERWVAKRHAAAREYLDDEAYEVETTCLMKSPASGLIEHIKETQPDVVVMATHGRGPISRSWIGSTTDRIIRSGAAPVLAVHPAEASEPHKGAADPVRTVLIPIDDSERALEAIEAALRLFGESIHLILLRVVELDHLPGSIYIPDQIRDNRQAKEVAQEYVDEVVATLDKEGRSVEGLVRVGERVSREVVDAAATLKCDAIAIATHGRGGLARVALGSVTDKVLRTASGPVLTVPRSAPDGER